MTKTQSDNILTAWLRKDHRNRRIIIECSKETDSIIFARAEHHNGNHEWRSPTPAFSLESAADALEALSVATFFESEKSDKKGE